VKIEKPKERPQAAVLLDFNESVDEAKIRKFEEFKKR
jgi:hypothetical protein